MVDMSPQPIISPLPLVNPCHTSDTDYDMEQGQLSDIESLHMSNTNSPNVLVSDSGDRLTSSSSDVPIISHPSPTISVRRSSRVSAPPVKLKDFICPSLGATRSSSQSFLFEVLGDSGCFSTDFIQSFANLVHIPEPCSYSQAKNDQHWIEAMDAEIHALEKNHTYMGAHFSTF